MWLWSGDNVIPIDVARGGALVQAPPEDWDNKQIYSVCRFHILQLHALCIKICNFQRKNSENFPGKGPSRKIFDFLRAPFSTPNQKCEYTCECTPALEIMATSVIVSTQYHIPRNCMMWRCPDLTCEINICLDLWHMGGQGLAETILAASRGYLKWLECNKIFRRPGLCPVSSG